MRIKTQIKLQMNLELHTYLYKPYTHPYVFFIDIQTGYFFVMEIQEFARYIYILMNKILPPFNNFDPFNTNFFIIKAS